MQCRAHDRVIYFLHIELHCDFVLYVLVLTCTIQHGAAICNNPFIHSEPLPLDPAGGTAPDPRQLSLRARHMPPISTPGSAPAGHQYTSTVDFLKSFVSESLKCLVGRSDVKCFMENLQRTRRNALMHYLCRICMRPRLNRTKLFHFKTCNSFTHFSCLPRL